MNCLFSTHHDLQAQCYRQNNLSKYFSFFHLGSSNNNGKIGFLDHNERKIESIQMQRTIHGEWTTTNQVLVSTNANKFIVQAVTRRSERIRNNQKARNNAIQKQQDAINFSQQQTTTWNNLPRQVLDKVINDSNNPAFNDISFTPQQSESTEQKGTPTQPSETINEKKENPVSQQMKDLKLWHQ